MAWCLLFVCLSFDVERVRESLRLCDRVLPRGLSLIPRAGGREKEREERKEEERGKANERARSFLRSISLFLFVFRSSTFCARAPSVPRLLRALALFFSLFPSSLSSRDFHPKAQDASFLRREIYALDAPEIQTPVVSRAFD